MRFSFVFSLIFQNPTLFRHTSILTNYLLLVTLKAKYQNDPNKVKKCHMFQVIEIFQARGISKYFLTGLKEHTVLYIVQYRLTWSKIDMKIMLILKLGRQVDHLPVRSCSCRFVILLGRPFFYIMSL